MARESGSIEIADRLIDSITARFFLLASYPYLGPSRGEDLRPGLRSFPSGEFVIIYRVEGEDVLILHVTRGSAILKRSSGAERQEKIILRFLRLPWAELSCALSISDPISTTPSIPVK